MGISNQTDAIIRGLECLISEDRGKTKEDIDKAAILQARNEELEKHIETVKKELEDLKSMQNNYMMQMQTLINQKSISAIFEIGCLSKFSIIYFSLAIS